jgi:glycerol-1-phosphate dehydrogenase [NAD(P)+]
MQAGKKPCDEFCEDRLANFAPVIMNNGVFVRLAEDLRALQPARVVLLADQNTWAACGCLVEDALRHAGLPVSPFVLTRQPHVLPDELSITQALQALYGEEAALVAVGSGTITDITRFVAFQARLPFFSVPTAASVDAYTSYTAAITIAGIKYSFPTKTAAGVYVHLPTLCAASPRLTRAGFGDMVAKFTALADWELAHLLAGDQFDPQVARQAEEAALRAAALPEAVRLAEMQGITALFDSLLVSGHCMVAVKSSRPAAGAEHSLAHFWEIRHRLEGKPETLHGEKTGVATVLIARLYEALRRLPRAEAVRRISLFSLPDCDAETAGIRSAYNRAGEQVSSAGASFLGSLRAKSAQVGERLLERWDAVQAIASRVPPAEDIAALLERAGALSQPGQIHVFSEEVDLALQYAMYVRDRFTILELNQMLALDEENHD